MPLVMMLCYAVIGNHCKIEFDLKTPRHIETVCSKCAKASNRRRDIEYEHQATLLGPIHRKQRHDTLCLQLVGRSRLRRWRQVNIGKLSTGGVIRVRLSGGQQRLAGRSSLSPTGRAVMQNRGDDLLSSGRRTLVPSMRVSGSSGGVRRRDRASDHGRCIGY